VTAQERLGKDDKRSDYLGYNSRLHYHRHGGVSDISGFGSADNVGEVFEMGLRPKDKPADL